MTKKYMDPRLVIPVYPVQFDASKPYLALGIPSNRFNEYKHNEVRAILQMGLHATNYDIEDVSGSTTYELFKRNIDDVFVPTSHHFFLEARRLLNQARGRMVELLGRADYDLLDANKHPFKFFRFLVSVHSDIVEAVPNACRDWKLEANPHGEHVRLQELTTGEYVLRVKMRSMEALVLTSDKVLSQIAENL
jgi:hypothetical protein